MQTWQARWPAQQRAEAVVAEHHQRHMPAQPDAELLRLPALCVARGGWSHINHRPWSHKFETLIVFVVERRADCRRSEAECMGWPSAHTPINWVRVCSVGMYMCVCLM